MARGKRHKRFHNTDTQSYQDESRANDGEIFGNGRQQANGSTSASASNGRPEEEQRSQTLESALKRAEERSHGISNGQRGRVRGARGVSAGQKRAATVQQDSSRPSRRMKMEDTSDKPYMDVDYIINNFEMPGRRDYPNAPAGLFTPGPKMQSFLELLNDKHNLKFNWTLTKHPNAGLTCRVTGKLSDQRLVAANGAARKDRMQARAAANAHLVSLLHTSGALRELLPAAKLDTLDSETHAQEADASVDIYNYAAKFGLIPQFTVSKVENLDMTAKARDLISVTIELPEQNIKVSAMTKRFDSAEIAASLKFKQAAETWLANNGYDSLTVRDQSALNTGNVKDFFEFLSFRHKRPPTRIKVEQIGKGPTKTAFAARVFNMPDRMDNLMLLATGQGEQAEDVPVGQAVVMVKKKSAEDVARLVAAIELSRNDPAMLKEFLGSLTPSGYLPPVRPVDMGVDEDSVAIMQETLDDVRRAGLDTRISKSIGEEDNEEVRVVRKQRLLSEDEKKRKNEILATRLTALETASTEHELQLRQKREALPMSQYQEKVLKLIGQGIYSVVIGATGSGKTTQVPQLLLEDAIRKGEGADCNVICTQPRRIAATSVARRVAEERNEKLRESVGYHVRFDSKRPSLGGSITYCTTGVLLQQLQAAPDETLDRLSHIIIDEVHERDILTDFLMIVVKRSLEARRAAGKSIPKVVLMSATIDSELFADYFRNISEDGQLVPCQSLSVPGRTFPVQEKFLDEIMNDMKRDHGVSTPNIVAGDADTQDYIRAENVSQRSEASAARSNGQDHEPEVMVEWKRQKQINSEGEESNERQDSLLPLALVSSTIAHICKTTQDGAVLVFLPGYEEMRIVRDGLMRSNAKRLRPELFDVDFHDASKYKLFMLHSTVSSADQASVFDPVPPGCRKIILSTNIAETSVTIPDIQHVVDTGKIREKRYDQIRRITKLQTTWISKSNAKQRAGRAGRVQNGNYYALYTEARSQSLRAVGLPEMLRSDLQEVCLDIKAQAFKSPIREFLSQAIEPPSASAIESSLDNLKGLQALTKDEKLTALGRLLSALPVHPTLGKMIVLGVIFRCLDPMIILGAAITERPLFVSPPEERRLAQSRQQQFIEGTGSDHYAIINAFVHLRLLRQTQGVQAMTRFAMDNFVHIGAFNSIDKTTKLIEELLVDAGLIPKINESERFEGELGHPNLNRNALNVPLLKALILAGLYPNMAVSNGPTLRTVGERHTRLHPSSLNYLRKSESRTATNDTIKDAGALPSDTLVTYSTMIRSNDGKSTFLRSTTLSTPLMAALFGGHLDTDPRASNILSVDGWLPLYVHASRSGARAVLDFRAALDALLAHSFDDLARLRRQRSDETVDSRDGSRGRGYLADDKARELFAEGLVDVLARDTMMKQEAPRRSRDRGSRGSNKKASDMLDDLDLF